MKKLYCNGTVLPMDTPETQEAMLTDGDRILAVGSTDELLRLSKDAERIDLCGGSVLPAFIDAHSHLSSFAYSFLQLSLAPARSFDDIVRLLQEFLEKQPQKRDAWLVASGYDHNVLKEKGHPGKALLDTAFPGVPVVLQHQSGHFGVFSSAALRELGAEGRDRDGYLAENDYIETAKKLPMPSGERLSDAFRQAQESYASYGITTVQEGMMVRQMLPVYRMLLSQNVLTLDVVGYPQISDAEQFYGAFPQYTGQYRNHFRLGGYKIILDGSPQGRTAWMKTPYEGTPDAFGISSMTDGEVCGALEKALRDGRQLLIHANGDAAAEQLLSCAERVSDGKSFSALRPVIIHAQLMTPEQLLRAQKLDFMPSFFVAHCYFWGDVHIRNFGMERAASVSPAKSALTMGIPFTFHQDTPVLPPDMLRTIWCAVNRKTKNGILLGAGERIPVYEALRAVTVNAARQYGEEAVKGTLSAGKNADFIVLDRNPLRVSPEELCSLHVLRTYKAGKCIYRAE